VHNADLATRATISTACAAAHAADSRKSPPDRRKKLRLAARTSLLKCNRARRSRRKNGALKVKHGSIVGL
jgi:hypothetical protein